MSRTCSTCNAAIGERNRSGLCRSCVARRNATDPAMADRMKAGLRARLADPLYRAEHVARCVENGRNVSDEVREKRRQHGRSMRDTLRQNSLSMTAEQRAENGRKRTETVLAWCPPEWRAKYKDLTKRGRRAAEAKRIVLDLIAGKPEPQPYAQQRSKLAWVPPGRLDEYRKLQSTVGAAEARRILEADMTPFERQLARVASGAKLITIHRRPRGEPTMTLGGVPSGLL